MSTTMSVSRGRLRAFRIVGWVLGVLTLGYGLFFTVASILSDDFDDVIHRFHNLGGLVGGGLIGVFAIVLVVRPDWVGVFQALVAQAFAWTIAGLIGGDFLSGGLFIAVLGVLVLAALHPDRRSLVRLPGRPSVAMLTYAMLVTVPAWIYAVSMAELQHGPASDPHVEFHHWSGMATSALGIAAAAIAASLRGSGWTVVAASAAAAAVLFGVAGLVFSDLAGAPGVAWSWIAVAAGVGYWLLSTVEAARRSSAT